MGLGVKKLVVAVSGGVDSVVLLDRLFKLADRELIVAHFDHGIRPESDADARFVSGLAEMYNLPFETKREELGANASEERARTSRHNFLKEVANKYGANIATAHHVDDVIETIAINCQRGTGWRGLAVLSGHYIERPLLEMNKKNIRRYALENKLEWVEDETNATDAYLRNRFRFRINAHLNEDAKINILRLWRQQNLLKRAIDAETEVLVGDRDEYSRYFFTHVDDASASELLRAILQKNELALTRPQRERVLHAVKTAKPGALFEAGGGLRLQFTDKFFIVETP